MAREAAPEPVPGDHWGTGTSVGGHNTYVEIYINTTLASELTDF